MAAYHRVPDGHIPRDMGGSSRRPPVAVYREGASYWAQAETGYDPRDLRRDSAYSSSSSSLPSPIFDPRESAYYSDRGFARPRPEQWKQPQMVHHYPSHGSPVYHMPAWSSYSPRNPPYSNHSHHSSCDSADPYIYEAERRRDNREYHRHHQPPPKCTHNRDGYSSSRPAQRPYPTEAPPVHHTHWQSYPRRSSSKRRDEGAPLHQDVFSERVSDLRREDQIRIQDDYDWASYEKRRRQRREEEEEEAEEEEEEMKKRGEEDEMRKRKEAEEIRQLEEFWELVKGEPNARRLLLWWRTQIYPQGGPGCDEDEEESEYL